MFRDITYDQFIEQIKGVEHDPDCPIHRSLELFNGKWKTRVLFELNKYESIRFGELKKAIHGITNTMLTATLKELEQKGLVNRIQYNRIPPHVEYSLTESGKALTPIFFEIAKWGETYLP